MSTGAGGLVPSRRALLDALDPRVRIVDVVGGPGMGKTRFVEALGAHLEARGIDAAAVVIRAGARPTGEGAASPEREVVRLLPMPDSELTEIMRAASATLGTTLPDVRALLPLLYGNPEAALRTARRLRTLSPARAVAALEGEPLAFLSVENDAFARSVHAAVRQLSKGAATLLRLLAVFEAPTSLDGGDLPEADALDELLDASLVQRRDGGFAVPSWVRAVVRDAASVPQRARAILEHARRVAAHPESQRDREAVLQRAAETDAPRALVDHALTIAASPVTGVEADAFLDRLSITAPRRALAARAWLRRAERDASAAERAVEIATLAGDAELLATANVELGLSRHRRGDVAGALSAYEAAYGTPGVSDAVRARALVNRGTALHDAVQLDQARECYEEAVGIARGKTEGAAWLNLGVLLHEEGELVRAGLAIARAFDLLAETPRLLGIAKSSLGAVRHEARAFSEAVALHAEAAELLAASGDHRSAGLCALREAVSRAACGEAERAKQLLHASEPALLRTGERPLRSALDLGRALVDALLELPGSAPALERAATRTREHAPTAAAGNDDVRFFLRLAERAKGSGTTLRIAADGSCFITPGGESQSLEKHPTARRILLTLRAAHRSHPVSLEELWEAGWAGQRAADGAWQNRVYVALSHLRSAGLRPFLRREERGYSLAPELDLAEP